MKYIAFIFSLTLLYSCSNSVETLTIENDKLKKDLAELSKQNLALEEKLKALEGDNLITAEGIGKVKLGMTVEELKTFSTIKIEKHENLMDGGYDEEIECTLKNGEKLNLVLSSTNPRKVSEISTRSLYFKTYKGFKAGMSVKDLKKISPNFECSSGEGAMGFWINNLEYKTLWMRITPDVIPDKYDYYAIGGRDNLPNDLIINEIGVGGYWGK